MFPSGREVIWLRVVDRAADVEPVHRKCQRDHGIVPDRIESSDREMVLRVEAPEHFRAKPKPVRVKKMRLCKALQRIENLDQFLGFVLTAMIYAVTDSRGSSICRASHIGPAASGVLRQC